jgi:outer membrane protein
MKKLFITAPLFLLFALASASQPQTWTLEACIRHACEHNLTIRQMEIRQAEAEINLNTSRMSRLPNLNAGAGQTWNFGRTQTETGLYENRSQSNANLSLSSSMPLFTGFRIPNEIARDRLQLAAATENLNRAREDLALNVASLFLQTLFNRELLKISEEQLELSQLQVERTRILVDAEKVPESQLFDIESQVAGDRVSVINADNNLKLSLLDLAQNLELERSTDFDIAAPEIDSALVAALGILKPAEAVFNQAIGQKPVIRAQELQVQIADRQLKIAQSGYLPTLNLSLGYGTNYFYLYDRDYVNRTLQDQLRNNAGEYIGLSLNIPIFNRFSVRNQVRAARFNIDSQQLALENAKKDLYKEIQTAFLNATAAQEKYRAAQDAVRSTFEALRYAQEKYEAGKSTVFEFNEAKNKYSRSRMEEAQAKFDYIFRVKILDFYDGTPISL